MSDSYVDLGYRGLPLGRRVKLTQVRPSTGYLEAPQPMPVGTAIAITTDDGVAFDATIAEIHEQVAGAERAPGMLVRPALDVAAARAWWEARVQLPELPPPAPPPPPVAPAAVVLPKRMTLQGPAAVPELIDDGRNTAVMEAVVVDDGLKTTVMDAVPEEIVAAAEEAAAAAEEDPGASGELPADPAPGDKPEPKGVKRRKKKR